MKSIHLQNYKNSVRQFIKDSKDWGALQSHSFYTTHPTDEWRESPDNSHGGLNLAWAFQKDPTEIEIEYQYFREIAMELAYRLEDDELIIDLENGYNMTGDYEGKFNEYFDKRYAKVMSYAGKKSGESRKGDSETMRALAQKRWQK
jgi:hypothetical protein